MAIYETSNKIIKTPFPEKAFESFKNQAEVTDESNLTENQIKKIFVLTIDSFLQGNISTDDIASICIKLTDPTLALEDRTEGELPDAMDAGSELGFYIRDPNLLPQFNKFLEQVLNYAEDFKTPSD